MSDKKNALAELAEDLEEIVRDAKDEVCTDCESRIECGLGPLAWRGESKEGGAK